jgi:hypothetical protein
MNCLHTLKKGTQCTRLATAGHPTYPQYCTYHIHRFENGSDIPNPVDLNNFPPPPPQPALQRAPRLNPVDFRIIDFLDANIDELMDRLEDVPLQQQDAVIFEIIARQDQNEQNFLIQNYERLFETIQRGMQNNENILNAIENGIIQNVVILPQQLQGGGGLVNLLLQALGDAPDLLNPNPVPRARNLGALAMDSQNVHTKEIVNPILENANKLIQKSKQKPKTQDTFKEIIYNCDISDEARKQLCLMYYSQDSIYNLPAPTYRMTLDGIVMFIHEKSPDIQKDIFTRLSQELEDNIGMCPQGNLSRVINSLAGFMEGVETEFKETLQDAMARIHKIENLEQRLNEGKDILKIKNIPESDWTIWLDALRE